MSDIVDQATELTEMFREEALRKQKEKNKPARVYVEGQVYECEECGIELNEFRAINYGICVDCQEEIEYADKLKNRR